MTNQLSWELLIIFLSINLLNNHCSSKWHCPHVTINMFCCKHFKERRKKTGWKSDKKKFPYNVTKSCGAAHKVSKTVDDRPLVPSPGGQDPQSAVTWLSRHEMMKITFIFLLFRLNLLILCKTIYFYISSLQKTLNMKQSDDKKLQTLHSSHIF